MCSNRKPIAPRRCAASRSRWRGTPTIAWRPVSRVLKNSCAAHLLCCGPPGVLTYCLVRSARQAPPRLASGLARDVFQHPAWLHSRERRFYSGRCVRTAIVELLLVRHFAGAGQLLEPLEVELCFDVLGGKLGGDGEGPHRLVQSPGALECDAKVILHVGDAGEKLRRPGEGVDRGLVLVGEQAGIAQVVPGMAVVRGKLGHLLEHLDRGG